MNKTDNFAVKEKVGCNFSAFSRTAVSLVQEMSGVLYSGPKRFIVLTFARHSVTYLFRETLSVSVDNILHWTNFHRL